MARPQDTSTTPLESRDEWSTPDWLYRWCARRFPFSIDLAASVRNAKCPLYLTREMDALAVDWMAFTESQGAAPVGWLNCPYSDITPWMQKAIEQAKRGFTTVMLVPQDNGEDRYGDCVHGVASEYRAITGRIAFLNADGAPVSGNTRGSALVVYRGHDLGDTRYGHLMRDAMMQEMREAEAA